MQFFVDSMLSPWHFPSRTVAQYSTEWTNTAACLLCKAVEIISALDANQAICSIS